MRLLEDLINAQWRPAKEARRLTQAVDGRLDTVLADPRGASAAEAVAEVRDALRATSQQIADEKNPRPAPLPGHAGAFTGDLQTGGIEELRDAEPMVTTVRTDPHFLVESDVPEGSPVDGPGPTPIVIADVPPGSPAADIPAPAEYADSEFVVEDGDVGVPDTETPSAAETASAQTDSSEVTGPIPVTHPDPSPADAYAAAPSPWDDREEITPTAPAQDPAAGPRNPVPSQRATAPPEDFDLPPRDEEPSLPQRVREAAGEALSRLGSGSNRLPVLVAAAVAVLLVIGVTAVLSLSGGRGKPPEPAGTVAAPPAQTENPEPTPSDTELIPATVSSSCGTDTDPAGPFSKEKSRAWVCVRANGIDGNILNIVFSKPVVITKLSVVPGFNYVAPDGRDEWGRHRLVTGITWRMGGKAIPQVINPTRTGVSMDIPEVTTKEMSLTITSSARPPRSSENGDRIAGAEGAGTAEEADATTAISSIIITGRPLDTGS